MNFGLSMTQIALEPSQLLKSPISSMISMKELEKKEYLQKKIFEHILPNQMSILKEVLIGKLLSK